MQTLPKIGDPATVAGITFPLTVESYDPNTLTANLKGEHPETGMEVLAPRVCLSLVHDGPTLHIGQLARLNSGGPWMTITAIYPPLPTDPEGAPWLIDCCYFLEGGGVLGLDQIDLRALTLNEAS